MCLSKLENSKGHTNHPSSPPSEGFPTVKSHFIEIYLNPIQGSLIEFKNPRIEIADLNQGQLSTNISTVKKCLLASFVITKFTSSETESVSVVLPKFFYRPENSMNEQKKTLWKHKVRTSSTSSKKSDEYSMYITLRQLRLE